MFNEVIFLQFILIVSSLIFLFSTNILVLWYIIGFILVFLGFFLLYDNFDIFIGFLWLIDLGVGLVFLVFILHFTNFLYKKILVKLNLNILFYSILILVLFFLLLKSSNWTKFNYNDLYFIYTFLISWYNYFYFISHPFKSDLLLLREIYFYNNSWEFIIINFFLLFGINLSISFFFLIKYIFMKLNIKNLLSFNSLLFKSNFLFIRNQNLIDQQDEGASLKIFTKKNYDTKKYVFKNFR